MEKTDSFLSIRDLTVTYTSGKDTIHAVNGVSFDLWKGKSLGLVGETGAGKTTIAKAIMRVLPMPPAEIKSGQILLNSEDLMEIPEKKMQDIRGRRISMIFQDPMTALNPTMTIGEQISEVIRCHTDMSRVEAQEAAIDMLESVGILGDRYKNYPHQLSGGQKQRVVIAIAMVFKPELLIADEPTTALDVTIQAQILEMIRRFRQQFGTSVIMITHDLGIVAENCDNVAVIYAGQIVEYGDLFEVFGKPRHPYTIGLFHSLPSFARGETRLHPIPGMPPDPSVVPVGCPFYPRCPRGRDECAVADIIETQISQRHVCRCLFPEE